MASNNLKHLLSLLKKAAKQARESFDEVANSLHQQRGSWRSPEPSLVHLPLHRDGRSFRKRGGPWGGPMQFCRFFASAQFHNNEEFIIQHREWHRHRDAHRAWHRRWKEHIEMRREMHRLWHQRRGKALRDVPYFSSGPNIYFWNGQTMSKNLAQLRTQGSCSTWRESFEKAGVAAFDHKRRASQPTSIKEYIRNPGNFLGARSFSNLARGTRGSPSMIMKHIWLTSQKRTFASSVLVASGYSGFTSFTGTGSGFSQILSSHSSSASTSGSAYGYSTVGGSGNKSHLRGRARPHTSSIRSSGSSFGSVSSYISCGSVGTATRQDSASALRRLGLVFPRVGIDSRRDFHSAPVKQGSYVDFDFTPNFTLDSRAELTPEAVGKISQDLECFTQELQTMMTDIRKIAELGELPITVEKSHSTLRIHFPNCDMDKVQTLLNDAEVSRGIVLEHDLPSPISSFGSYDSDVWGASAATSSDSSSSFQSFRDSLSYRCFSASAEPPSLTPDISAPSLSLNTPSLTLSSTSEYVYDEFI